MSRIPDRLRIASRSSRLALKQAALVSELVTRAHPAIAVDVVSVSTHGDRDHRPFSDIGGKGLFVKDVETALRDGRADVAVHSAKDLTSQLAPGCTLVCVPRRGSVEDAVVGAGGPTGEDALSTLPPGARVGTSSTRRVALLAESRPDVEAVSLRGNLDTRLDKVDRGEVDAAVLAAAGIERLSGVRATEVARLDPDRWTPAPGQGALAVEAVASRVDVAALFERLSDEDSWLEVLCERTFAARLEAGCSIPLGCLARVASGRLVASAFLGHPDGGEALRDRISGRPEEAEALGNELAEAILDAGGRELLEELKGTELRSPSPP